MDLLTTPHTIKLIAFLAFVSPALVMNIRNGTIPNTTVLFFLAGGIAYYLYEHRMDAQASEFGGMLVRLVTALVVGMALFAIGSMGAGAAKLFATATPWFSTGEYLTLIVVVGVIVGLEVMLSRLRGRDHPDRVAYGPRIALAGFVVIGSAYLGG